MEAIIYVSGEIGKETTLIDVIRQFKSYEEPTSVLVKIKSEGGSVEQGDSIFKYLEGLKKTIQVNTYTDKAYSISAKIFSIGEVRIVEDIDDVIMIHNPWVKIEGGANDLREVADILTDIQKDFSLFYSDFLDIPEISAQNLLEEEKFFSASEAVEMGFATEIKKVNKAVAKYSVNLKLSKMSKKESKKESKTSKLKRALLALLEADVKALVLKDSAGTEIEFKDLEEGEDPKKGDFAEVDGEVISDGNYVIPSYEDKIFVFKGGEITEIKEAETEAEIQARLNIKAEEVQQVSVWTQEANNESFEVGEIMTYEYDGENYPYGAGEFYVPSIDKNVVTDASGKIVVHKDKVVVVNDDVNDDLKEIVAKLEDKISLKFDSKFKKQEKKIQTLNKLVGSKEFEQSPIDLVKKKSSEGNYLTSILNKKKHSN